MISFSLRDAFNKRSAKISQWGEVAVSDLNPSTASFKQLAVDDQAYNFILPKVGCDIFITGIDLYADRNVGANDAQVIIYANGTGPDGTDTDEILYQTEILKQSGRPLTGLKLKVTERGMWVNGKTNDNNVYANIFYYYAQLLHSLNSSFSM